MVVFRADPDDPDELRRLLAEAQANVRVLAERLGTLPPTGDPVAELALAERLAEAGQRLPAALVEFMAFRRRVDLDAIKDAVHGEDVSDGAVGNLACRTTALVRRLGSAIEYRRRGAYVVKFPGV